MSPKTTPNAERPRADRLAAFTGRATVSTATLDKGPTPAFVEVLHSVRSRSTSAIYWQAERLRALFCRRPRWLSKLVGPRRSLPWNRWRLSQRVKAKIEVTTLA